MDLSKKDLLNVSKLHLDTIETILDFYKCNKCHLISQKPQQCSQCFKISCNDCNSFCLCQNSKLIDLNEREIHTIRFMAHYVDKTKTIIKKEEDEKFDPQENFDEDTFISTKIMPQLKLLIQTVTLQDSNIEDIRQLRVQKEGDQLTKEFIQEYQNINQQEQLEQNQAFDPDKYCTMWKCSKCTLVLDLDKACPKCKASLAEFDDIEALLIQVEIQNQQIEQIQPKQAKPLNDAVAPQKLIPQRQEIKICQYCQSKLAFDEFSNSQKCLNKNCDGKMIQNILQEDQEDQEESFKKQVQMICPICGLKSRRYGIRGLDNVCRCKIEQAAIIKQMPVGLIEARQKIVQQGYSLEVRAQEINSLNPLVKEIRKRLGPFNYEPSPPKDNVKRIKKQLNTLLNGSKYEGELNEQTNKRDGRGYYIWAAGYLYEGYWKDDKLNGRGRLIKEDGMVYDGEWKDDKMHGFGVYTDTDGFKYEGNWKENTQDGQGKQTQPDGGWYEGNFIDGQRTGNGKQRLADGTTFEGQFLEGKFNGKGVCTWPDGNKYEGDFVAGKRQGKGKLTYSSGVIYDGHWLADQQHGDGIIYYKRGGVKMGQWQFGEYVE